MWHSFMLSIQMASPASAVAVVAAVRALKEEEEDKEARRQKFGIATARVLGTGFAAR